MCGHACAMENVWRPEGTKASHFSVFIMWVSRLNWGCQTWQQVPSHTEASCWLRGSCPPVLLIHANITDNFWTFPENFHHHYPLHSSSFSLLCVCDIYVVCVCVLFMMCMYVLFMICMCVSYVYCLSVWYIICMCGTSAVYVPCACVWHVLDICLYLCLLFVYMIYTCYACDELDNCM